MLDGRYDPAFAQYFTQNAEDTPADWPKEPVTFGFIGLWGLAALSGALALFIP